MANNKLPKGVSVIVNNEDEFNKVKSFLGKDVLYLDWHENMLLRETAVVLRANKNTNFSSGSLGCAEYQRSCGIKTVHFQENLIHYLI